MAFMQSERWITPSDWENNIGHDGQFGDDEVIVTTYVQNRD